jgi:hypothetical protein
MLESENAMFRFLFCLLILFSTVLVSAETNFACPTSKDYQRVRRIGGYSVQMLPGPRNTPYRCRGTIRPPNGVRVTVAKEWALTIDDISGADVNGAGGSDVVFDAFTGGEHCCYIYWIVGLKKKPEVIRQFRNQVPLVFRKRPDGGTEIRTGEGSFDLFMLPHSSAVIPQMVLRLQGTQLVDISAEHKEEYDLQIEKARKELSPADLQKFRESRYNQKMFADQLTTVKAVLTIVLNYLYSGREPEAWQALDEMWPPSDKDRVRGLILERRARGLLAQTSAAPSK